MHIIHVEAARDLVVRRKAIIEKEEQLRSLDRPTDAFVRIGSSAFAVTAAGDAEDIVHLLKEAAKRDRHAIDQRLVDLGVTL